jgi:hypothetical protein
MDPDIDTVAAILYKSPDADEAYCTMLRRMILAGERVLGPKRADAMLAELLVEATQR